MPILYIEINEIVNIFVQITLVIIVISLPLALAKHASSSTKPSYVKKTYNDFPLVNEDRIKSLGYLSREIFTSKLKEQYTSFENALSTKDTKKLKSICTEELYNEIKTKLETDNNNSLKINSLETKNVKISEINISDEVTETKLVIRVKFIKYDEKENKTTENITLSVITFIKDNLNNYNKKEEWLIKDIELIA